MVMQNVDVAWRRRRGRGPLHDGWLFYESLGTRPRSALTREQAEVAAICDLRQEVNSGGFDSYFRYWGGNTAKLALAALPVVLGDEWARLLGAAMSLLGDEYPEDPDAREARLGEAGVADSLSAFDARFYDLEVTTDADALVAAYLARSS